MNTRPSLIALGTASSSNGAELGARFAETRFAESEAFAALGEASFALFAATRAPGKVVWCNFELAHKTDRCGGDGVTPALGAGRAGFLREGNL